MVRFRHRSRGVLHLLTALALLMQGMLVVACDLHDAAHVAEAAAHGHAADDLDQHPEQADDGWHALFHAGHHCQHVTAPAALPVLRLLDVPQAILADTRHTGPPDAPPGNLLRPPIQA